MPVYNEGRTLAEIVRKVAAVNMEKEIIIVNDGSRDETPRIMEELEKGHPEVRLMHHVKNAGKGAAVRTGISAATGDILIVQDADLEYDPEDYHACVRPIVEGRCRVVYGSRVLNRDNAYSHLSFYFGGRLVTLCTNLLFGSRLTDAPTCYKTFAATLIKSLTIEGNHFNWEPEVTAKVLRMGERILEVPIRYYPRSIQEGKHIRWRDGLEALWTLLKYRFSR
jgi:glycosyltransferase involved in cell wall biosynthesis